jgi:hypothetical protein
MKYTIEPNYHYEPELARVEWKVFRIEDRVLMGTLRTKWLAKEVVKACKERDDMKTWPKPERARV